MPVRGSSILIMCSLAALRDICGLEGEFYEPARGIAACNLAFKACGLKPSDTGMPAIYACLCDINYPVDTLCFGAIKDSAPEPEIGNRIISFSAAFMGN
jgi:hypothetical protein